MAFTTTGLATPAELRITFAGSGGSERFLDPDSDPTLVVSLGGEDLETITSGFVHTSTGIYSALWTPLVAGTYSLTWTFTIGGTGYTSVQAAFALTSEDLPEGTVAPVPDVGAEHTCTLTGTFIDAAGNFLSGVHVRFSPDTETARVTGVGFAAADVTAASDANGLVTFTAVRGVMGLLAISGTSLVRQVTIPDQASADIFELAASADDLLQIQELVLIALPRRS